MKILMICDFFPNKYKPYEGTFFLNHAKVLSKLGKVKVQTLIRVNKFKLSYEKWNIDNIDVEAIVFFYKVGFGFIFFPLAVIFQFLLTLKNLILFKPDRIILQMALPHGLALIPFKFLKKIIILEHSPYIIKKSYIAKLVYKFSFGVYALSNFQKQELENNLKISINGIIPNPVFEFNFNTDNSIKNRIICVGRILPLKGQLVILEVAKMLKDIEFILIGEFLEIAKDEFKKFKKMYYEIIIKLLKELKNVRYLGPMTYEETLKEISNSDFLISTSKYETFGMTMAEALSLGKPVIWTDSGGPRDFLNEKNSILVKERTPIALKNAIIQAYEKLKNGYFNPDEIKKSIFEYCSKDKVLEAYKKALKF
ncbi:MAG: glycosyltransferase family 4 protein [candidate division WOR-3 bacterium]